MPTPIQVMPDAIAAVRGYLLDRNVAPALASRIYGGKLTASPILPAARIIELSMSSAARGWARSLLQIDVWHSAGRQRDCHEIARMIAAGLESSDSWLGEGVVLGGTGRDDPPTVQPVGDGFDETVPGQGADPVPRYMVTAGVILRPR